MSSFDNLKPEIKEVLNYFNYLEPTKIQAEILPEVLDHKSVAVVASTGTGKTLTYLLPIFNNIDVNQKAIQSVILVPTRELAMQVFKICQVFSDKLNIRTVLSVGGKDLTSNAEKINNNAQIIVATPRRLCDLYKKYNLDFSKVKILVFDEADMIFDLGFFEDVATIYTVTKKPIQTIVLSATINEKLQNYIKKYLTNILIKQLNNIYQNPNLVHYIVDIKHKDKYSVLHELLKSINPFLCLIFVNTNQEVNKIYEQMIKDNYNVAKLHGDLNNNERKNVIKDIKNMKYQYVVASDLASRGIDIDNVSHVISWQLPIELDWYIHRAGRSGRYNQKGASYLLYEESQKQKVNMLAKKGIKWNVRKLKEDGTLTDVAFYIPKHNKHKLTEADIEIKKAILFAKNDKVRPNYKKNLKLKIEKIKQKHKHERIEESVQKQLLIKWKKASAAKSKLNK